MLTVLVDIGSGNLHSAEKAFRRMAGPADEILVSPHPGDVARADRIVLPGDGAFPACRDALMAAPGLHEALIEAVTTRARPFLGICVGMQLMATEGLEFRRVPGLDWIAGRIEPIAPADATLAGATLKVPHMGWNDLVIDRRHPVLDGIATGDHAYFVHSFQFRLTDPADLLAHVDYAAPLTAIVGRGTMVGTQFHPEKSQATGLRLIANFLGWRP